MRDKVRFTRATPGDTYSTYPTRDFKFVIDPPCLNRLIQWPYRGVANLIADLRHLDALGVRLDLLLPSYLSDAPRREPPTILACAMQSIPTDEGVFQFTPHDTLSEASRELLSGDGDDARRARALLALTEASQSDGVVTENRVLVEAWWQLYQHHRIRIVPLGEFGDTVEVCAHGHGIFWSATDAVRLLNFDLYYNAVHRKCRRLTEWFGRIQTT